MVSQAGDVGAGGGGGGGGGNPCVISVIGLTRAGGGIAINLSQGTAT